MIRMLYLSADGKLLADLNLIDLEISLHDPKGVIWVDFEGAPNAEAEPILRDKFHFHPLAIDDALQENHSPKLDDWGSYLYIVMHTILFDPAEGGGKDAGAGFLCRQQLPGHPSRCADRSSRSNLEDLPAR
ncbi:MAG: hypothetical protein M5U05_08730 [Anaerolineales bacterium]|nr:hypothetical protein [Anaerolineales bacterium]